MARPPASTWGRTTVSRLGAALPAGAALPCSLALRAAAAPKLPPPLGSVGSPKQHAHMRWSVTGLFHISMPKIEQVGEVQDILERKSHHKQLCQNSNKDCPGPSQITARIKHAVCRDFVLKCGMVDPPCKRALSAAAAAWLPAFGSCFRHTADVARRYILQHDASALQHLFVMRPHPAWPSDLASDRALQQIHGPLA